MCLQLYVTTICIVFNLQIICSGKRRFSLIILMKSSIPFNFHQRQQNRQPSPQNSQNQPPQLQLRCPLQQKLQHKPQRLPQMQTAAVKPSSSRKTGKNITRKSMAIGRSLEKFRKAKPLHRDMNPAKLATNKKIIRTGTPLLRCGFFCGSVYLACFSSQCWAYEHVAVTVPPCS